MEQVEINTEYIKLDQFLKWSGACDNGVTAKSFILDGLVRVNGSIELQRGKKLRNGDIIEFENMTYEVVQK
ncbi:ribosome-associated protein [Ruminiclostridium sufflavum DSM 19573]|uniref:Ribosome-associated protein n=1 Tax=Ruminiclostridium sufflavum DSM 19573 TaxID=1121337 RepID=A0A318XN24_9FIRM|nr:RNA-binding S4 domain-containing protein [Ruminiclostridium sufflavum]PYG88996.1 ribosome-associated protein [Ruminiclostridium sufflavum DSM 19573]